LSVAVANTTDINPGTIWINFVASTVIEIVVRGNLSGEEVREVVLAVTRSGSSEVTSDSALVN